MMFYFLAILACSFGVGIVSAFADRVIESRKRYHYDARMFGYTVQENIDVRDSISRQKSFVSLLSNVALVLIVLLLYWLCL